MLDNMQQDEGLLDDTLKEEKKGYRKVVEMKERKRALDKSRFLCRIPGQNRIEKTSHYRKGNLSCMKQVKCKAFRGTQEQL